MSLDPRLLDAFQSFDAVCREHGIRYTIEANDDKHQAYLVKLGDSAKISEDIQINPGWVTMRQEERPEGVLFEFFIKTIGEDQYKAPTRKMIRKQSGFRSSFGPSRSFGGVSGYGRKLNKKMSEELKLKDDLLAHDNKTIIPSGTELEVHDPDPGLPDVDWGGTTTNVDKDKLEDAITNESEAEFKEIFREEIINEQASTIGNFLTSKIHNSFTHAADSAFGAGYMTQAERIALSSAISKCLDVFTDTMKSMFPKLYTRAIDSKDILGMNGTFRERIERRISNL